MAVEVKQRDSGNILEIRVSGKLAKENYDQFVPMAERMIQEKGKVRMLFEMHDFHGWEAAALWEDIKFDIKHFKDIERLAMVGESKWQQGMASFCKPFTTAKVKYFDASEADQAARWLEAD